MLNAVLIGSVVVSMAVPRAAAQVPPPPPTSLDLSTVYSTISTLQYRLNGLDQTLASQQYWATGLANAYVSFGKSTVDQANMDAINALNGALNTAYRQLAGAQTTVSSLKAQVDAVAANIAGTPGTLTGQALAAAANTLYSAVITVNNLSYTVGGVQYQVQSAAGNAAYLAGIYVEHGRDTADQANMDAINALNGGLNTAYREISDAQGDAATLRWQVDSLILSLSWTANTTAWTLQSQALSTAYGAASTATSALGNVNSQLTWVQSQAASAAAALQGLPTTLLTDAQRTALSTANGALGTAGAAAANAQQQINSAKSTVDSTTANLGQAAAATAANAQWQALSAAYGAAGSLGNPIAAAQTQIAAAQAQLNAAAGQLGSLGGLPVPSTSLDAASAAIQSAQDAADGAIAPAGAALDSAEELRAQVQVLIDDVVADAADTLTPLLVASPGGSHVYDLPVCEGQWLSVTTGTCTHADGAPAVADSYETYESAYLSEVAATGGYCRGDSNPMKYRVLYLYTGKGNSRLSSLKDNIRDKAKKADYYVWKSARQQGRSRHIRYACNSSNQINVTGVRLPRRARENKDNTFDLIRAWGGYDDTKRYVAFTDWQDSNTNANVATCGWGEYIYADSQPGVSNPNNLPNRIAISYLRPDICYNGSAGNVLHEVGHTLGATLKGAPHNHRGHPTDKHDALEVYNLGSVWNDCSSTVLSNRYDCKKNDYWNTDPTRPARGTYLADHDEYLTGVCQRIKDPDGGTRATECRWNTAWNVFLVGGG